MIRIMKKYLSGVLFLAIFFLLGSAFIGKAKNKVKRDKAKKEIVVSTWNIGHFANGKQKETLIKPDQYKTKLKEYRAMIYDTISADIIGINEYSAVFAKNKRNKEIFSSNMLFNKYVYGKEDNESWICNSYFSDFEMTNYKRHTFECSKSFVSKDPRVALFHYVSADTDLDGENVKFVFVHLVSRQPSLCQLQIEELITKYKGYKKVVMLGDWNTWDWSKFKKAGYLLANDGSLITFPSKKYALDNVIVKGLKISDVRVIKSDLSDHYPLVCKISL